MVSIPNAQLRWYCQRREDRRFEEPFLLDAFQRAININLVGAFDVIRLAVQAMLGNEVRGAARSVIINTASVVSFDG